MPTITKSRDKAIESGVKTQKKRGSAGTLKRKDGQASILDKRTVDYPYMEEVHGGAW